MENHKFVTARFINNERTTVEIEWQNDAKESVMEITEADGDDLVWVDLLTHTSLEDIHENTVNHNRAQRKIFETLVMKIANEEGLVESILKGDIEEVEEAQSIISSVMDMNEDEDILFRSKLEVMELPIVKSSINKKTKQDIRKAKSLIELISCIAKL